MSHWIDYLPEVGRPFIRRGEEMVEMAKAIKALEVEHARAVRQHEEAKKALLDDVLQHWTLAEVNEAENTWAKEG
jgi:hypothetical protein